MVQAIYSSFYSREKEPFDTKEEAIEYLEGIEEMGEGYAIGIYDEGNGIIYLSKDKQIIGKTIEEVYKEKLEAIKEIGIEPKTIEYY